MDKFSGIDLHSNNSVVVVSDDADRVVYQRRLPNDPVQIRAALAPHREDLVGVVIEATYNWYWLVDQLIDDGYRVHLANPAAIRQYEGLKYSGDFTDAAHLAQLLRLGLLPEGYIYPPEQRPVRDLSRKRIQLVQCRTAQILAIENLFSRHTGGQKKGEGNTKNGDKYLAWAFVEAANFAIRSCPEARRFYERKKRARNAIVAIKALAHKLARACYHMLREHKSFEVTRCFG
uniref:Transposase n=2 Tax=Paraburkholderia franconis TaxID=2654983 RepID=A0A7X1NH71_9BURK